MTGESQNSKHRPDRAVLVIAAILAGISLLIFWKTLQMPVTASYARIGPTTVPYLVAGGLMALAVGTGWSGMKGWFPSRSVDDVPPIMWIAAGLIAQMLLLKTIGFVIATALLFALTARAFGKKPLWHNFVIGFGFALVVWLIFAIGLKLSIPDPLFRKILG